MALETLLAKRRNAAVPDVRAVQASNGAACKENVENLSAVPDVPELRPHGTFGTSSGTPAVPPEAAPDKGGTAGTAGTADYRVSLADDRITCLECANLQRIGQCLAAKRFQIKGAGRNYSPIKNLPRRCEGFIPLPDDPDQRTGRERWPSLI